MRLTEHPQDLLAPLRDVRSPISTRAIRERVFERAASLPLWRQLQAVLAEGLIVGVAVTAVLRFGVWAPTADVASAEPAVQHETPSAPAMASQNQLAIAHREAREFASNRSQLLASVANEEPVISGQVVPRSVSLLRPAVFVPAKTFLELHALSAPQIAGAPNISWFTTLSGGAMFSELRILAERGEIGFEDGWKTAAFAYTNADGAADIHGMLLHHPGLTTPFLSQEGEQQYSLLLGANFRAGAFEFRGMIGPSYIYSSSQNYAPITSTSTALSTSAGFGVSAEASALYSFNSSVRAGVTSVASYGSSVFNMRQTSGLFASFTYRFGQ